MVKRALVAVVVLALTAVAVIWRMSLHPGLPEAAAQTAGQAIPVTAGTVAVEDVPVFLHGIVTF